MPSARDAATLAMLAEYWSRNFSGKNEGEVMDLYGDGSFHRGAIGGVDRQYRDGVMNEYKGIGDAGFDLGGRFKKGRNQVPSFVGFTASDIYTKGGPRMKDVYYDQLPNAWNMYQHPYDASRWGDYLPGSDEERAKGMGRAQSRGHNRGELASEIANRIARHTRGFRGNRR